MIDLCLVGATGRMGKELQALLPGNEELRLVSGWSLSSAGEALSPSQVKLSAEAHHALKAAQVYIDFSTPAATKEAAQAARKLKCAAVIGTTGLDADAQRAIDELAEVAPVLLAANFSLGVNLMLHLARKASAALGGEFDMEIVEAHHRNKVDAPSGTALALGKAMAEGKDWDFESVKRCSREGQIGPRSPEEIGISTIRGGNIVGDHRAMFISPLERIEIAHHAQNRSVFAAGALRAASWLAPQLPGKYSMASVLGL